MIQAKAADFRADLRDWTIAQLKSYGVRYKDKDDLTTLLVKYYTFLNKYIVPQKRMVLFSKELIRKVFGLPLTVQNSLKKLIQWINMGVNINCFQGRGLYGAGSRDYQNLLYDVVHLHLSASENDILPIIKKNGFAKPVEYILIACFTKEHAFFIDVIPHPEPFIPGKRLTTEWISKEIAKIIVHNWPVLVEDRKIKGVSLCDGDGNPISLTDDAIALLTASHVNTLMEIDGSVYMLGEGTTASGISTRALRYADKTIHEAILIQKHYEKNREQLCTDIMSIINKCNMHSPVQLDFHFQYIDDLGHFAVVERCSNIVYDYKKGTLLFSTPE